MPERLIKRYKNRKLYDTTSGSYVSLIDIAGFIREGDTVHVTDRSTGEDITPSTLVQIILEEGKKGDHILPTELLHDVVRKSSETVDEAVRQVQNHMDGLLKGSFGKLSQWLESAQNRADVSKLKLELSRLEELLSKFLGTEKSSDKPS